MFAKPCRSWCSEKLFYWAFYVVKSLKLWSSELEISFIFVEKPFILTNLDNGVRSLMLYWTFRLLLASSLCWWWSKLCKFIKNTQQNTKVECKRNCNAIELKVRWNICTYSVSAILWCQNKWIGAHRVYCMYIRCMLCVIPMFVKFNY